MSIEKYETVIGLEVHVQLATESKAFCSDDASFGGDPNTHISTISLGHPGTLPKANSRQIEYAVKLGLALGCEINHKNYFDRKNYFYADLPKGYQITQDREPVCIGGELEVQVGEATKKIRLHHIHMEEDAGKSMHDSADSFSYIDLNRAGVPLLEIVTEPDFRSAEEVDAFMTKMRQLVRYLEVSDGNMEQGSMRCDCNVSIRLKGDKGFNNRCEIKNMNSMRYAKRAINYEMRRQAKIMESGGTVAQQTLNFDPETGITSPLRSKEDAHDYRYFPEPDLPPVILTPEYTSALRKQMPPMPWEMYEDLMSNYGLSDYDANLLTEEKPTALFYKELCTKTKNYKSAANLIINKIKPYCDEETVAINDFPIDFDALAAFIQLIDDGKVSNTIAYQRIFPELIANPKQKPLAIAEGMNLIQSSDEDFLEKLIDDAIAKFPDKVKTYQKGKKGLLGFFMGEVMRNSKGKADPKATNAMLAKKLKG